MCPAPLRSGSWRGRRGSSCLKNSSSSSS
jgi:hypothetical protein